MEGDSSVGWFRRRAAQPCNYGPGNCETQQSAPRAPSPAPLPLPRVLVSYANATEIWIHL